MCTQAVLEPTYGLQGLELLRSGRSVDEALAELTSADEGRDVRQVAIMDVRGNVAQHGAGCVQAAGHRSCG